MLASKTSRAYSTLMEQKRQEQEAYFTQREEDRKRTVKDCSSMLSRLRKQESEQSK